MSGYGDQLSAYKAAAEAKCVTCKVTTFDDNGPPWVGVAPSFTVEQLAPDETPVPFAPSSYDAERQADALGAAQAAELYRPGSLARQLLQGNPQPDRTAGYRAQPAGTWRGGDWTQHNDPTSYEVTCANITEASDLSGYPEQLPTYEAWHAHRAEHAPEVASKYPEVHQANAQFYAMNQEFVRLGIIDPGDAQRAAQTRAGKLATTRNAQHTFTVRVDDCQGLKIEPLPDGEQRAAFAKFADDCTAAVLQACDLPPQQESQERAVAPNLQLPVTSGSSDGAQGVVAYERVFQKLRHECQRLDTDLSQAKTKFAKMQLSRDRCARERDSATASSQQAHADAAASESNLEEAKRVGAQICEASAKHHAALAAAAAQFRAITGDFPGLSGPLVDLFKDVK